MPELPEPTYVTVDTVNKFGKTALIIQALSNREFNGPSGAYSKAHLIVEFPNHVQKDFYPLKLSERLLSASYGNNTDLWVGKQIEFNIQITATLKEILVAKPLVQAQQAVLQKN